VRYWLSRAGLASWKRSGDTGKDALQAIKAYFNDRNRLHDLRESHAFHFDRDTISEALDDYPHPNHMGMMVCGDDSSTHLFEFADSIAAFSYVVGDTEVDLGELEQAELETLVQEGLDELVQEVNDQALNFHRFGYAIILLLAGKAGLLEDGEDIQITEVTLTDVPSIDTPELPFFVLRE